MLARTTLAVALTLSLAGAAAAQVMPPPDRPTVVVTGTGKARKPAEFALVGFTVRGEGKTPTEAIKALNDSRSSIEKSLVRLAGAKVTELMGESLSVQDVRTPACEPQRPYAVQMRLTSEECAVIGAIASINIQARIEPAEKVGEAASLVAQLGGKNPYMRGSGLRDRKPLDDDAMASAVGEARRQAEVLAKAAGVKLGPILRIMDGNTQFDSRNMMMAAPPPPAPPMPIPPVTVTGARVESPVDLTVRDIEANARVTVMFAIEP
ncbi:SIMPL domain-containing protein [Caulobacter sp. NIBR2454]|uniref:SIMPL domain-containing protein n=1 Tax=Caulobacter sp. NIBR2454 TaxID=3015996 RepID=UPI0022B5FB20|nr:SIMPL domain-containing protein [Caulobacter sp. NIBR2454]